jgi:hypothetical protein
MKAILEFDLNDPNEIEEFKRVNKALYMALALLEIDKLEMTRKQRKQFLAILDEYKIDLEDIIS